MAGRAEDSADDDIPRRGSSAKKEKKPQHQCRMAGFLSREADRDNTKQKTIPWQIFFLCSVVCLPKRGTLLLLFLSTHRSIFHTCG